jgi:hypothetical protein
MALGLISALTSGPKIHASRYWLKPDFSYKTAFFTFWATVEIHLAIIALSIPALRLEFEKFMRVFGILKRINARETFDTHAEDQIQDSQAQEYQSRDEKSRNSEGLMGSSIQSSTSVDTESQRPIPWAELEELSHTLSRKESYVIK